MPKYVLEGVVDTLGYREDKLVVNNCPICYALVLDRDTSDHYEWHLDKEV